MTRASVVLDTSPGFDTVFGDADIYVLDRDTDTTYQFDLVGIQRNPSITADGRSISFESNAVGGQYDIYVADNPLHDDFMV